MGILTEVWAGDIASNLFPENTLITMGRKDDQWVENHRVHRANSGAVPNVQKNRATVPATAVQRTDADADYLLAEYTSDPTVIRNIEEVETSYNKRSDILADHIKEINRKIANDMLFNWAPSGASSIIRTEGAAVVSSLAGATGNRKEFGIDDFVKAQVLMDEMEVPEYGRCMAMPPFVWRQLIKNNKELLLSLETSGKARLKEGRIESLFGFRIFRRSSKNCLTYTNAATPVARDPNSNAGATTANASVLCWHPDYVARALGNVKVYSKLDDPQYYGSIFSAEARAGGNKIYNDGTGVVAIVESAAV